MNAPKEILDFITQPENLNLAIEISYYVENLKRSTHHDFWVALNHELSSRINSSDLSTRWQFKPFYLKRLRADWEKTFIVPTKSTSSSKLQFAIGQGVQENNFQLYCGVCWNTPPTNFDHPQLTHLKSMVIASGLSVMEPPVWLGWNYLQITPFTPEFINSMYARPQEFVTNSVQMIWNFFIKLMIEMESVNQVISN